MNEQSLLPPYPGENASPSDLLLLANQYKLAAEALLGSRQLGTTALRSPATLCAIHATELYLQALIRSDGASPKEARGLGHALAKMSEHPSVATLKLRQKTMNHLAEMTARREYIIVRYGPDQKAQISELTRLRATLEEVARKVQSAVVSGQRSKQEKAG